jgi:hypothetical protein
VPDAPNDHPRVYAYTVQLSRGPVCAWLLARPLSPAHLYVIMSFIEHTIGVYNRPN